MERKLTDKDKEFALIIAALLGQEPPEEALPGEALDLPAPYPQLTQENMQGILADFLQNMGAQQFTDEVAARHNPNYGIR